MIGKKPPITNKDNTKWTKMSKSKGNVIRPEEVVYGVSSIGDLFEFRNASGEVLDYKAWGVWRDEFGTILQKYVPNHQGFIHKLFYTAGRYGFRPVFLHNKNNPIPCLLTDGQGNEYSQHYYLIDWWTMMLDKYEKDWRKSWQ